MTPADTSPSSTARRIPVVVLSTAGFAIAVTLTLFQVGVLDSVWEPFFGDGSRRVLESSISRALPVPDASLGAVAYLAEAFFESIGDRWRWRDRPVFVDLAGLVAAGLGLAALGLVALQALVVQHFCTLCLASAAISLLVALLVAPEVVAAIRHRRRTRASARRAESTS